MPDTVKIAGRTIELLGENNYIEWQGEIEAICRSKRTLKYLDGRVSKPATSDPSYEEYMDTMEELAGLLWSAVEKDQHTHFEGIKSDGLAIWNKLARVHNQQRPTARFDSLSNLLNATPLPDESLTAWSSRVSKLLSIAQSRRSSAFSLEEMDREMKWMVMLLNLPEQYAVMRHTLLNGTLTDSTIAEAFAREDSTRQRELATAFRAAQIPAPSPAPPHKYHCDNHPGIYSHNTDQCRNPPRKEKKESAKKAVAEDEPAHFAGTASHLSSPSHAHAYWVVDSAATASMTARKELLCDYKPFRVGIELADGKIIHSAGIGSMLFSPAGNGEPILIPDILHVPHLSANLFSIIAFLARHQNYVVPLTYRDGFRFTHDGRLLFTASIKGKLAHLDGDAITSVKAFAAGEINKKTVSLGLLHRRLGHIFPGRIEQAVKAGLVTGVTLSVDKELPHLCEPCIMGKHHRDPFPPAKHAVTKPLELVFSDLHYWKKPSFNGFIYSIFFLDAYTDALVVYHLKKKSEAFAKIKEYKEMAEGITGHKLLALHDDAGGEYMSLELEAWKRHHGIADRHTMTDSPASNGKAERIGRTVEEGVIAMMDDAKEDSRWWPAYADYFVKARNALPTSKTGNKTTPHILWYKRPADISMYRTLGCTAYVHVSKKKRGHLDPHSIKGKFIGFAPGYHGWRIWDPKTRKVIPSRDVIFAEELDKPLPPPSMVDEAKTTESKASNNSLQSESRETAVVELPGSACIDYKDARPATQSLERRHHTSDVLSCSIADPEVPRPVSPSSLLAKDDAKSETSAPTTPLRSAHTAPPSTPKAARIEDNPVDPPSPLNLEPSSPALSSSDMSDESIDPIDFLGAERLEKYGKAYATVLSWLPEPTFTRDSPLPQSYTEAMKMPDAVQFQQAIDEHFSKLSENDVLELADLPPGRKALPVRWVFFRKFLQNNTLDRHTARVVGKGFKQIFGVDYEETFAAVIRWVSLRTMLAIAAGEDYEIQQIDFSSAFLQGKLEEEIYIQQPEGFHHVPGKVYRLKKALPGIKQASRCWAKELDGALLKIGFVRCQSERALYKRYDKDGKELMAVYVDDELMAGSKASLAYTKEQLKIMGYKFRDEGDADFFLGVEITRDRPNKLVYISQVKFINDILSRYKMDSATPAPTPMAKTDVSKDMCPKTDEEKKEMEGIPYASAIGALIYLAMISRPDIAYAVHKLSQFTSNPGPQHWQAVKRVLRYLGGSKDLALVLGNVSNASGVMVEGVKLEGYSDADWAGDTDTRKSTSAYAWYINGSLVSWLSKKQPVIATSTAEAEYIAACTAAQEGLWLRHLLEELDYTQTEPTPLHLDNQSALAIAKNPEHHSKVKHMDIRYHFLCNQVEKGEFKPVFVPTSDQAADIFTKPLSKLKHQHALKLLGMKKISI